MDYDQLKLENQLCFPVYAASRLITRAYQPLLEPLGITYPQYLVLMVLWETDGLTVNEIGHKLILNTNTVTPLLKRMETQGLIERHRDTTDERRVMIALTQAGQELKATAAHIPQALVDSMHAEDLNVEEVIALKTSLEKLIQILRQDSHHA